MYFLFLFLLLTYSSIQAFAIRPTFSVSSPTALFESNGENIPMNDSSQLLNKKSIKPGFVEDLTHRLQLLDISHSQYNVIAYILKPANYVLRYYQSLKGNNADYIYHKYLIHGENFACAGGLWMSNFEVIKENLIEPQARAFKLAPSELDKDHLPRSNLPHGRMTFLLALSQEGAGGNGDWEAYRGAINDYIVNPDYTRPRANDDTAKKLLEKLVTDYKAAGVKSTDDDFFEDSDSGLLDFLLKYLHHVLFGLDPFDPEIMEPIKKLHYESKSAAYFLNYLGNILQVLKFRDWPEDFEKVRKIYEESPAISAFNESQKQYKNMTRQDLSLLMVAIMSLAGMVGSKTLAYIVLGKQGIPDYDGEKTYQINVADVWDKLNLNDRDEVKRYIYECGRLRHPVSNTHKVATEDFTARVGNKDVKFKKGTIIYIPMILAGLNTSVYGKTTFDFDHNRENLCPFSTIFHSFGKQTNGRVCPGQEVAEEMMIDVLIALGECRL
jgi:hypothetical protein